jgi:hypothetical protein
MSDDQCTIVTAFYDFPKKKHTTNSYYEWINNFLPILDSYIIIFTDEKSYEYIHNLRKNFLEKTVILIVPLENLFCYKFIDYWNRDYQRDHEKNHDPLLYIIWNEKSMFMQKSMELNPFNTDFYAWTDIGMVRDKEYIPHIHKYPNPEVIKTLKRDKVYILNLNLFNSEDLSYNGACELFRYKNDVRTGGGVILAHKNIIPEWTKEYYNMMIEFIKNDYFAGKDQSIMSCVYLKNRENLIELIKPRPCPINHWFYLLYFFSNK